MHRSGTGLNNYEDPYADMPEYDTRQNYRDDYPSGGNYYDDADVLANMLSPPPGPPGSPSPYDEDWGYDNYNMSGDIYRDPYADVYDRNIYERRNTHGSEPLRSNKYEMSSSKNPYINTRHEIPINVILISSCYAFLLCHIILIVTYGVPT
jgi:hypothetical protein